VQTQEAERHGARRHVLRYLLIVGQPGAASFDYIGAKTNIINKYNAVAN